MIPANQLLSGIPAGLRDPLLAEYKGIVASFLEGKWKYSGTDAGRFCEIAFTILDGATSPPFATAPKKPSNFPDACRALESRPPVLVGDRSLRVMLPRLLPPIYEIRNNRDVGHVGGDVVSNKMDATYVAGAATFALAELVRVFHGCPVSEAQRSVDALVERRVPAIWDFGNGKRVIDPEMTAADKTVLLLYQEADWTSVESLKSWIKYQNGSLYRNNVLAKLDAAHLIEFDTKADRCLISPLGIRDVEARLTGP